MSNVRFIAHAGLELAKRLLYPRAMRKQRRAAAELGSPATQLLATAVRFRQAGQWVAAEACYRQVLAAQPNLAEAHCNLGSALAVQRKLDEAIAAPRAPALHYR